MTLVKMKDILTHAEENHYGVGAFSVANMEMVMVHGGSGISEADFRKCIRQGIRKINVAASTFNTVVQMVNEEAPFKDYFSYHEHVIEAAAENVKRHMQMFQSVGRAKGDKAYV